jgi:regulatory protein
MIGKKEVTPKEALERLEALCAKSERCSDELRTKLVGWRVSPAYIEKIIDSLRSRKYVDDERFAHAYVRDKWLFSRWGRRKIIAGLAAKRIPSAIGRAAVADEIDEDEYYAGLLRVAAGKLARISGEVDYETGMKVLRSLVSAGYEPGLAARAVREAAAGIDKDDTDENCDEYGNERVD